MSPSRTPRRPALLLALLCLLGSGCARLSVSHLETRPLIMGSSGTLTMKYFAFAYAASLDDEAYALRGHATARPNALPAWADRLEELTITVYLSDAHGQVVARAEKTYPGMRLTPDAVIPFSFRLLPETGLAPGALSVSFGYKAVFGSSTARQSLPGLAPPPPGAAFFAGEGAVLVR